MVFAETVCSPQFCHKVPPLPPMNLWILKHFSPHHCVGFLFWICTSRFLLLLSSSSASPSPPSHLSHTSLSHLFVFVTVTHHLSHTSLSHTHLSHTPFSHAIFHTHLFHTRHLSHTLFHTQLSHTTFTHIFVTHHLSHAPLSHTIFHTPPFTHIFVTWRHPPPFCVAGVALGDTDLPFAAWQAWRTPSDARDAAVFLRGRRGTM